MNIEKAIKILEERYRIKDPLGNPDYDDAIKLGIEALKQVKERRTHDPDFLFEKLPVETRE